MNQIDVSRTDHLLPVSMMVHQKVRSSYLVECHLGLRHRNENVSALLNHVLPLARPETTHADLKSGWEQHQLERADPKNVRHQSFSWHQLDFQNVDQHLEDQQRHSRHLYLGRCKKGLAKLHQRLAPLHTQALKLFLVNRPHHHHCYQKMIVGRSDRSLLLSTMAKISW